MNEAFNELEEAVRERLICSSADVPEVDAVRARVLDALEADHADLPTEVDSFWARRSRTAQLLAGVAALIAAAALFLPKQRTQTVVVTADELSNTETAAASTDSATPVIEFADVNQALDLSPPLEEFGTWVARTEAEQAVTLEFVAHTAQPGDPSQYLRIVAPPSATTAAEVVESLTSSLFDTTVVYDQADRIGGLESRTLRLETGGGTTHLGFKIASSTYLRTEGIDRVFVVHIVEGQLETLVFWIEADPETIDEFEAISSRLVAGLSQD